MFVPPRPKILKVTNGCQFQVAHERPSLRVASRGLRGKKGEKSQIEVKKTSNKLNNDPVEFYAVRCQYLRQNRGQNPKFNEENPNTYSGEESKGLPEYR
jgi:hypothetical protein